MSNTTNMRKHIEIEPCTEQEVQEVVDYFAEEVFDPEMTPAKQRQMLKQFMKEVKMMQEEKLLKISEVAKALRVDDTTVKRWIKNGVLEAVALPSLRNQNHRVRQSVVDAILNTKA